MRVLVLVVVVACGGGSAPPAQKPAPDAASCAAAADGMVGLLPAAKDPDAMEAADGMRRAIAGHCDKDQWSAQARRCFKDMKTADDANVCGTLLTDDQQAALVNSQPEKSGAKTP